MSYENVLKTVIESIQVETGFDGEISESSTSYDVEGWDSLAHARIIFRTDIKLGTTVEMSKTHGAGNVGELAQIFLLAIQ